MREISTKSHPRSDIGILSPFLLGMGIGIIMGMKCPNLKFGIISIDEMLDSYLNSTLSISKLIIKLP
jgi:hypothetical protein